MADKKVERNLRSSDQERPQTPTQKMTGALSDSGNVNIAEADKDKGKTALFDRFRDRDERYRREQSIAATAENASAGPASPDVPADETEEDEGGDTPSG
jgi:hypothetical protein